jgi:WD40 repeat protein
MKGVKTAEPAPPDDRSPIFPRTWSWPIIAIVIIGLGISVWLAFWNESALKGSLKGHKDWIRGIAFSPNGKLLASCSKDCTVKVWDVTSSVEIATLTGHSDEVWSVAFSPDSRSLGSASLDGTVKVWDLNTGKEHFSLKSPIPSDSRGICRAFAVSFSPDGKLVAWGGDDGFVRLADVATGRSLEALTKP